MKTVKDLYKYYISSSKFLCPKPCICEYDLHLQNEDTGLQKGNVNQLRERMGMVTWETSLKGKKSAGKLSVL